MHNVTTPKHTFRLAVLLAVLLSGACYPFAHRQFYPKQQVTAKEGISVLISSTSRCLVPTKDFPKINVGEMWACNWRENATIGGTSGTRPAVPK
jgi:hypothetical protein